MSAYLGLIRKNGDVYNVTFPDFPQCKASGDTLEAARSAAIEALAVHLSETLRELGKHHYPTSLDEIMADESNRSAVAVMIDAPVIRRLVRVNVILDEDLLKQIAGVSSNRSRYLVEAAREKLARDNG